VPASDTWWSLTSLAPLTLTNNRLGGFCGLSPAIAQLPLLEVLILDEISMCDYGATGLALALATNAPAQPPPLARSLRDLRLCRCNLVVPGSAVLAVPLPATTQVKRLDLICARFGNTCEERRPWAYREDWVVSIEIGTMWQPKHWSPR
jgi:hypothetical protein